VINALYRADNLHSKLEKEVLSVGGFTSHKIRHFMNNMCNFDDVRYLEIGVHLGATLFSASYKNKGIFVGIDNFTWCNQDDPKARFEENRKKLAEYCPIIFIEGDCWDTDVISCVPDGINVYFYDGAHDYQSQYKALIGYAHKMADEFVYIVDDWDWNNPKKGTFDSFIDAKVKVTTQIELCSPKEGDGTNWWNGIGIFILQKQEGR